MSVFPTGKPREEDHIETVVCKTCKRPVLKQNAAEHIRGCIRAKQEKARKKKEARDAANRAKAGEKDGDEDGAGGDKGDGDDTVKAQKSAKKSAVKGMAEDGTKKGKKRKAEGDDDNKDKEPKKKKKKEEQKPKAPKPKGPVDVEKQCGVPLPNGAQCARSLTCKSHSMGAKRAVPGRSLPYDMLLQAYQKKNQARQQSMFTILNRLWGWGILMVYRGGYRRKRTAPRRLGKQWSCRLRRRERRCHGSNFALSTATAGQPHFDIYQEEVSVCTNQGNAFTCAGWCPRWWALFNWRPSQQSN